MTGSSVLNEEQAEFYSAKFGVRYSAIAENPVRPSRKIRRALKHGQGRQRFTDAEVTVLDAQREAIKTLKKYQVVPVMEDADAVRVEGAEAEVLRDAEPPQVHS